MGICGTTGSHMNAPTMDQKAPNTTRKPIVVFKRRIPRGPPKSGKRGILDTRTHARHAGAKCLSRYAAFLVAVHEEGFMTPLWAFPQNVFDLCTLALAIATKIVKNGNTTKRAKTTGTDLGQLSMSMRVITWLSYKIVQGYDDEVYDRFGRSTLAYKCLFEGKPKDQIARIAIIEHAILQELDYKVNLLHDTQSTKAEMQRIRELSVGSEVGVDDGSFFVHPSENNVFGKDPWSDTDDDY